MTSRACSQPMQAHESRARGLQPASGAQFLSSSPAFRPRLAGKGRGARLSLRPLHPNRIPEVLRSIGFPGHAEALVFGSLAHFPPAQRVPHSIQVYSHLRRVSLPALACRCSR